MSGPMHTRNTPLSHTTLRLILIRAGMDHKGDKNLSHNIYAFLRLELETSG